MTIKLTFKTMYGETKHAEFDKGVATIDLSEERYIGHGQQMRSIDLKPLTDCTSLRKLDLSGNSLRSINLRPLSSCKNLEEINLDGSRMRSINLSPLAHCTNLKKLGLGIFSESDYGSYVTNGGYGVLVEPKWPTVDLSPLSACPKLETISTNGYTGSYSFIGSDMDLTPLLACAEFDWNSLRNERGFTYLRQPAADMVFPVSVAEKMGEAVGAVGFQSGKEFMSKKRLRTIVNILKALQGNARHEWKRAIIAQDILEQIQPGYTGYLKGTPDMLQSIYKPRKSLKKMLDEIQERINDLQYEQIDAGGTTIGIDIEEMKEYGHNAVRIPHLLELRINEIRDVRVLVVSDVADLRALWLTAYGFEILRSLRLGTWVKADEVERVLLHLNNATDLAYGESHYLLKSSKKYHKLLEEMPISQPLREFIWRLADQRILRPPPSLIPPDLDWYRGEPFKKELHTRYGTDLLYPGSEDPSCRSCMFNGTEECPFVELGHAKYDRPKICQHWLRIME